MRGWRKHTHDIVVALAGAGWILFMLGIATFSDGWVARATYGLIVASWVALTLAAYGSEGRRSS